MSGIQAHIWCKGDGSDRNCATVELHRHCVCGLPMTLDAEVCDLCLSEGLIEEGPLESDVWDGKTYPSRRRKRQPSRHPENYLLLAKAVGSVR